MKETSPAPETDPRFPSGPWVGFWIQKVLPPGKHRTELHLHFSQGVLTGEGRDRVGKYHVRGRYDLATGRCHWTKRYVGRHDVFYEGFNEGKGIWGTWKLPGSDYSLHGGFHIWPKGMLDAEGHTLHEEAELPDSVVPEEEIPHKRPAPIAEPIRMDEALG